MTTDADRIDWLEQRGGLLNTSINGPHVCIDDGRDGNFHAYGNSYREAVDRAMLEYVPFDKDVLLANLEARYLYALREYERAKALSPSAAGDADAK